jgi:hypothetical protein
VVAKVLQEHMQQQQQQQVGPEQMPAAKLEAMALGAFHITDGWQLTGIHHTDRHCHVMVG